MTEPQMIQTEKMILQRKKRLLISEKRTLKESKNGQRKISKNGSTTWPRINNLREAQLQNFTRSN